MKKWTIFPVLLILFISVASGLASPVTYTASDSFNGTININVTQGTKPDGSSSDPWFTFNMPTLPSYFTYDSTKVTAFTITLEGTNDPYPTYPIDTWVGSNSTTAKEIGSYGINNGSRNFNLIFDLVNNTLSYQYENASNVWGPVTNVGSLIAGSYTLAEFNGLSSFVVGYDCSFYLYKTDISITENCSGKTPEPATMILYGLGFAGAGLYRRMRSKVKN